MKKIKEKELADKSQPHRISIAMIDKDRKLNRDIEDLEQSDTLRDKGKKSGYSLRKNDKALTKWNGLQSKILMFNSLNDFKKLDVSLDVENAQTRN